MNKKILVIASAGGHLTQAMCATSLCENIVLVSNKKNYSDTRINKFYKIFDTQHNAIIHLLNVFFAIYVLLLERPRVVFSTGGPIALPFALTCKIFGIKFIYLDTLSRVVELSNTAKLIHKYRLYSDFYCQWQSTADKYKVKYIGKCFDILGENSYSYETIQTESKPIVFVTVGTNQYDFDRLFDYIYNSKIYKDERVNWIIQTAHNKLKFMPKCGQVLSMVGRDEIESIVRSSSLVISHCGIGSINLMLSYQKQVIFVPRVKKFDEFSDDHQLQIAKEINSDLFQVVFPKDEFPSPTYEELMSIKIAKESVDITNHIFAKKLYQVFFECD